MAKFRIQAKHKAGGEPWWEDYTENEVVDQASADKWGAEIIDWFNAGEVERYGKKGRLRVFIKAELIDAGVRKHNLEKQNLVTLKRGHQSYDKMRCTECGYEANRWGLGHVIKPVGKWRAKKYLLCAGGS
jgi:hypothetical protein